jgi:acyl-CoA thioester hydrolase
VHHSNYPVWFEAGRTDFIRKMGLPYSKIEESGALLPLIELKCRFNGFARYEDDIVVKTNIVQHTGVRLAFHYEVYRKGSANAITEGETVHVWTDSSLKPVNIRKFKPEINKLIEASISE